MQWSNESGPLKNQAKLHVTSRKRNSGNSRESVSSDVKVFGILGPVLNRETKLNSAYLSSPPPPEKKKKKTKRDVVITTENEMMDLSNSITIVWTKG